MTAPSVPLLKAEELDLGLDAIEETHCERLWMWIGVKRFAGGRVRMLRHKMGKSRGLFTLVWERAEEPGGKTRLYYVSSMVVQRVEGAGVSTLRVW